MTAEGLERQIAQLRELVSPRVGIVRDLVRIPRSDDEPVPPILYRARLSNFDFKTASAVDRGAAGKGLTELEAIGGAIGEAIEHYCGSHPTIERIRRATLSAVGPDAVRPEDCVLFSKAQYATPGFPFRPLSEDTEIDWLPVTELSSGKTVLAPAALVHLNPRPRPPEENLCPSTSNGLAAGPDLASAIVSGLCELAERDGFLLHWMNRLPAPELELSGEGPVISGIVAHYRRFGVETRIFDITTNLPMYAMMAVTLDRSDNGPAAVFALGCNLDPRRAVIKSLFEMCQVRSGVARSAAAGPGRKPIARYQDIQTLEDHSGYFADLTHLQEIDFLLAGGPRKKLGDLPNRSLGSAEADLQVCVTGLAAAGHRAVFAELTTDDLSGYPIRVVRTIAPGLQPMHFGFGQERLGGKRLFEMPYRLGYTAAPRGEADLNPCPHPLA
jgi:ribosomal protein S12 methylthiotransferase accessory factor